MEYLPAFNIQQPLYGAFCDAAQKYPKSRAFIYMRRSFTYREALKRTDALASNLVRMGFGRGDILTVCLPNIPDAIYWFYAVNKIGAIAHLVHPLTPPDQMREIFTRVNPKLLVVLHTAGQGFVPLAQEKNIQVVLSNPADFLPFPMRLIYNLKNPSPKPSRTLIPAKPLYFNSFNNTAQWGSKPASSHTSDSFDNTAQCNSKPASSNTSVSFDNTAQCNSKPASSHTSAFFNNTAQWGSKPASLTHNNPAQSNANNANFGFSRVPNDFNLAAVYLHSGGTSGAPKTIALSNYAVNSLAAKGAFALGTSQARGKVMLSVLPMFHGFGMCMGIHAMLCHGGCNAIMPKFSAKEAVCLLGKNRLHFLIGVPILYEALLKQKNFNGKKLKNIDVAFVGGDFVPHVLLKRADERFAMFGSKARLFEGYGLTETVTVCAVNTHAQNRENSVGKPLPGIIIEAADAQGHILPRGTSGELYVTGDTLMLEYLGDAAATAETFFVAKHSSSPLANPITHSPSTAPQVNATSATAANEQATHTSNRANASKNADNQAQIAQSSALVGETIKVQPNCADSQAQIAQSSALVGETIKVQPNCAYGEKWVKTGDFGFVDADGFVFFRQRIKRIVKVSGVSVYPFEVEQLVSTFAGVTAVCALDVPDVKHGSMLQLFVACPSLTPPERELLRAAIADTLLKKLSVYAVPKKTVFLNALPTTSVGKIDAELLRKSL